MKRNELTIADDLKLWAALSCPVKGLRLDARTLTFLDGNGDGQIRMDEVRGALAFLKERNVEPSALLAPDPEDAGKLEKVIAKTADLEKLPPSPKEKSALDAWEAQGRASDIAVCGEATAEAEAAFAAVEPIVDAFFTPPDDLPLVTDAPDVELPLRDHLNPRHLEAILRFGDACVTPLLGARTSITRLDWAAVKAKFAPYRAWIKAKPVVNADAKKKLEEEEKLLRFKLYLGEFLRNFVTMDRLDGGDNAAIFQVGVLRLDGREMNLCVHVESEAAHAALAEKSKCCLVYVKLYKPGTDAERCICAVVTAGTVNGLYVGRRGVFCDRDGGTWEAVVTRFVEAQVSLSEAFWDPWRKVGEGITATVKKFLGDRQTKALGEVTKGTTSAQAGGTALASSVAAVGIGFGMVGAGCASVMAAISKLSPQQFALSLLALVLVVSLPSVALAWFKLRQRDLGAVLNACGWAVNREMRLSVSRAHAFTRCAKGNALRAVLAWAIVLLALGATVVCHFMR